ncbi:MAG: isochorismate synthase [Ilumatobacteraceae bacterium]|nr:isochorismate synthase [Ilumatobacteraceae bacterium]
MRATTRPLSEVSSTISADQIDLTAIAGSDGMLFVRNGVGFATRGIAARVASHEAKEFLSNIQVADSVNAPGSGPVLIGAIPFDSQQPHDFVLPKLLVCKSDDGRCWVTTIQDTELDKSESTDLDLSPIHAKSATSSSYTVTPGVDIETYLHAVTVARDAVRSGAITKAVIARDVFVTSSQSIDIHSVLLRLRNSFGSSFQFSVDGFVGASPELLVSIVDGEVSSHPLAGTAPRTGDPTTDARLATSLLSSTKNQIEHRIVIDAVHDTLLPWCSYLDWEPEASIIAVANVQHLGTHMLGRLSEPFLHVLDAVYALSPTPALGGHPRDKALKLIADVEGMSRGRYGGAVGWFDAQGNGVWAVAIRCAEYSNNNMTARLFAGGGIVADSEPLSELAETQAKLQAMLAAIIRP